MTSDRPKSEPSEPKPERELLATIRRTDRREARALAWKIYVELDSRISTQTLPAASGSEAGAIESLYRLFTLTREAVADAGPESEPVGPTLLLMLNQSLRPFLAYWHGILTQHKGGLPPAAGDFRTDLELLQIQLEPFSTMLRDYANTGDVKDFGAKATRAAELAESVRKRRPVQEVRQVRQDWETTERAELRTKRERTRGIALSGGGIRSATFSMGVLQALSERGLYSAFDYLSTVSGGGYTGTLTSSWHVEAQRVKALAGTNAPDEAPPRLGSGFEEEWSALRLNASVQKGREQALAAAWAAERVLMRARARHEAGSEDHKSASAHLETARRLREAIEVTPPSVDPWVPEAAMTSLVAAIAQPVKDEILRHLDAGPFVRRGVEAEPAVVDHVRRNTRYLVDGGIWRLGEAALRALGGIASAMAWLALAVLVLGAVLAMIHPFFGFGSPTSPAHYSLFLGAGLTLAYFVVAANVASIFEWRVMTFVLLGLSVVVVALTTVEVLWLVAAKLGGVTGYGVVAALSVLGKFGTAGLGIVLKQKRLLLKLARALLAVSPFILLAGLVVPTARYLMEAKFGVWDGLYVLGLLAIALAIDVNEQSWQRHYRDSLQKVFCWKTPFGTSLPMSTLAKEAPYHLVNATVNLPSSDKLRIADRSAAPVVFTRKHFGHPEIVGDELAMAWGEVPEDLELAQAMAISGAAVSSMMGSMTVAGAAPWLSMLNLRLGYWIRNPSKPKAKWVPASGYYLLCEMMGRGHENMWRLNVSDGGHFENLAAYELIRRRCAFIVIVDGEADGHYGFGGLMTLVRLARIDFGAEIRILPDAIRPGDTTLSTRRYALGEILYDNGLTGRLLYVKASCIGREPGDVLAYRTANASFPHQSTGDQFFDEAQFEAYRALGYDIGVDIIQRAVETDTSAPVELESLFAGLESLLYLPRTESPTAVSKEAPTAAT